MVALRGVGDPEGRSRVATGGPPGRSAIDRSSVMVAADCDELWRDGRAVPVRGGEPRLSSTTSSTHGGSTRRSSTVRRIPGFPRAWDARTTPPHPAHPGAGRARRAARGAGGRRRDRAGRRPGTCPAARRPLRGRRSVYVIQSGPRCGGGPGGGTLRGKVVVVTGSGGGIGEGWPSASARARVVVAASTAGAERGWRDQRRGRRGARHPRHRRRREPAAMARRRRALADDFLVNNALRRDATRRSSRSSSRTTSTS